MTPMITTPFPADATSVIIDPAQMLGPVKYMNAVNNGPKKAPRSQRSENFAAYRAARIPFARIHDANFCTAYGAPHTVDVSAIFPNFDADPDDPASYGFTRTDTYLQTIAEAGTEVFYRLGEGPDVGPAKYATRPPRDAAKWARICEHIVRHYTEGWAGGPRLKIRYWEIWNEPDLNVPLDGVSVNERANWWNGTATQFFDLYEVAAKHLKKCFPHLKIGGPAIAFGEKWAELFIPEMRRRHVPIDFFSWHSYGNDPARCGKRARFFRELLDRNGYRKAESVLDEWNYVQDWGPSWVYSLETESGAFNLKGAAFTAAVMSVCQDGPVDLLMYYDARVGCGMNGMFDPRSLKPSKGYYPFYAWAKLLDRGTQVRADVTWAETPGCGHPDTGNDLYVTAAVARGGRHGAAFVTRFTNDNNVVWDRNVRIAVAGVSLKKAVCHLTDSYHTYTEVPAELCEDGSLLLAMEPCSFVFVEW